MTIFKAACIQLNSGPEIDPNLRTAEELIQQAADAGAQLVALPENVGFMVNHLAERQAKAAPEEKLAALPRFCDLAQKKNIWLMSGSFAVRQPDDKLVNRCYVISPDGRIAARYDKIHLFDVTLPNGEVYQESQTFAPGACAVTVPTLLGVLGLSICYDLRFARLYRTLAQAGAQLLCVPAAFTVPTGRAHWHVLLRARAIETGSYVLAPAQCGTHAGGRETFGHSLIIGPWGDILAEKPDGVGFICATINLDDVAKARATIPAWQTERPFEIVPKTN